MKSLRKTLSAILCALILVSAFSVTAGAYYADISQTAVQVRKVSGKTGDCSYEYLVANGKLYISGNGAMADYDDSNKAPWIKEYNTHTHVGIANGVTYIGTCAFKGSTNLNELIIGNTVQTIGEKAFYNCSKLTSVTIPDSVTQIGDKALGFIDKNGSVAKVSGFTISADFESVARQYAKANGFNFVSLNGIPDTEPATEPVTDPITEPATEPVTQPLTEPEVELEDSEYSLWVGTTAVNSSNASAITGSGLSGDISYDPDTLTLTLDNAKIESFPKNHNTSDNKPYYSGIYSGKDLTIRLIGENTVKESDTFSPSSDYYTIYGVASATGFLTFTGSGKLTTDGIDAPYIKIDSDTTVNSNSKFTSSVVTGGLVASTVTKRNSRAVNTSTLIVDGTLQASQGGLYGEIPAITAKDLTVSKNATLTVGLTVTYLNVSTIRDFYAKAAKAIELTGEAYIGGLLITVANCTAPTYDFDVNEPVKTGYGIFGSNAEVVVGNNATLVAEGTKRALYGVSLSLEDGEYVKRAGASESDAVDVEIADIDGQSFVSIEARFLPTPTDPIPTDPTPTDPTPTDPIPTDPIPTDPTPTDPTPTDPTPTDPTPTDPTPTDPTPTDPTPTEPTPTDPTPTDPTPTDPIPTDPTPTEPTPTDPIPTDPTPTEPTPTDPTPTDPTPTEPTPTDPTPTEPTPTDPTPTDPAPTDPAPTDPIPTDPAPTDPIPTDPTPTEPTPTDPAPTDPTPTDPTPTEPTPTEPTPTEPTPTDPTPTEPAKTDISKWNVSGIKNMTFTGKVLKQKNILVSNDGEYADISVKYKNNVNAGTATVTITGKGDYTGTIVKTFKITKAANPVKVTAKASVNASAKKKTTIKSAVKVTKAQGKVTYTTNNKKVTVKSGTITVAKGLKKGKTYKVKITVTAKGNGNYKSKSIVKTIKIKVK